MGKCANSDAKRRVHLGIAQHSRIKQKRYHLGNQNVRSSAGHLAKQSRALRHLLRRHHALGSVLLRRSGHGGGRAVLLRGGSRGGRARRGAADGALTRHFCGCFWVVVRKNESVKKKKSEVLTNGQVGVGDAGKG